MTGKITKVFNTNSIRMWIDGKCFNIRKFKDQLKKCNKDNCAKTNQEEFTENTMSITNVTFIKDEEGKLYTSFELPKFYYQKLQTQKYFDINTLSEKTNTKIIIPEVGQEGKLKIIGDKETNIQEALNKIHSVIAHIRDHSAALQFATIPLLSQNIQTNFEKFKKEVLEDKEIENIDESIFLKKEKLHITINIFVLHDDKELKEAANALTDYKNVYLVPLLKKTGPLKINVEGIECMNSNYNKVNVVYAKANILGETEEANLQKIANELSWHFYERGLLKSRQESVKIHMTLMNVKFRKVPGCRKKRNSKLQSIDASKLMEKYGNYKFGTCNFDSIRIALISATPGKDGFYKTLSEVNLLEPENDVQSVRVAESKAFNLEKQVEYDQVTKFCGVQSSPQNLIHLDESANVICMETEEQSKCELKIQKLCPKNDPPN